MKILYLTPGVFDKGGISRYNRYQIKALKEILGADQIKVLSYLGPSGTSSDLETPFEVNWNSGAKKASLYRTLLFSITTLIYTLHFHPEIIWNAQIGFSFLAWVAARLIGAKLVGQGYGWELWTPRRSRPDIFWGFKHADYTIADSHFSANYIDQILRPGKKTEVIWDCVDIDTFTPRQPVWQRLELYGLHQSDKKFRILTVGRMIRATTYKGYERLLDIFALLAESQIELVYAGGGELIQVLKEKAEKLGVGEHVIFTGFVDEHDLPDIYRSGSVFCLIGDRGPGRGEGIPLTPLEAAACGIPILVGDQDGSKEAVDQGVNGYSLDPYDLNDICAHLRVLIQNPYLRTVMGNNAREKIIKDHSFQVFKEKHAAFLKIL